MISLSAAVKIYVCTAPTDMRKGFDGLCGLAEHVMQQDPLSGHLFVFRNRRRDRLKVMYWDHDGLAIWYKRLEKGTFQLPTDLHPNGDQPASVSISVSQLNLLLGGIDLASARQRKRYQRSENRV
jgi:transposase